MPYKPPPSVSCEFYKIVLFGARGAGKRTNLQALERAFKADNGHVDGDVINSSTSLDLSKSDTFAVPIKLVTVESDESANTALALRGLHGMIFVSDSAPEVLDANMSAMALLISTLSHMRIKIDQFPVVIQYNKRDLDSAISIARLEEGLNPLGIAAFSAVAKDGIGTTECLKAVNLLIGKLQPNN